jgi:hypothetical protein
LLALVVKSSSYNFEGDNEIERLSFDYLEYYKGDLNYKKLEGAKFTKAQQLDFGQSKEPIWIRIIVKNISESKEVYVMLPIAHIDSIRMYDSTEFGVFNYQLSGDMVKNSVKNFKDPYQIFKLTIKKGGSRILYFKISSSSQIILPFTLANEEALYSHTNIRNVFFGAFVGVLLVMFFYNLIVYLFTGADSYTYYIFYLISIATAQIGLTGISNYIFGEMPVLNNSLLFIGSGFAGVFSILFIQSFLTVKLKLPKLNVVLNALISLYLAVIVLSFLGFYDLTFKLINVGGGSIALTFALVSGTLAIRGDRKAKFYFTAWIGLIISVIVFTLVLSGFIEFVPSTNFIIPFGVVLETVLLSLALADSINILREESKVANQRVIDQIEKNEELVLNQNIVLEKKVTERTAALQKALDELKAAQSQLVQSEKMASLGTLTAGIAHEINNPINFVSANVLPLRDNITDLTKLIKEYKGINESNYETELLRLAEVEKEMDLEYTLVETKQLIDGIEEGANRTHTIVQGLTSFSRGDSGKKTLADINRGIRSTVSVLKSRLNNIKLGTNLDQNLPLVFCQVGKINQVVLNLMNNALDALEEKNGTNRKASQLMVETKNLGDSIQIIVSDNANGIDKELQRKIMEPFYTTKDVGKGTGLGLSISYSIIEDHGGAIEIDSEMGVGTKFIVNLPKALQT